MKLFCPIRRGVASIAMFLMVCALIGCGPATAMPPGDVAEPEPGPVVYDARMLERDGVLSVRNGTDQDLTGVSFSFVPKRELFDSALSDRVTVSDSDGYVHIQMDDAPAGGESVLDMSGFLHMYWSKDCESYFSYEAGDGSDSFAAIIPGV